MKTTRALILFPIPNYIGVQAALRPDVQYMPQRKALVVPSELLRAIQQLPSRAKLNDVDSALHAACHEYFGYPITTIPLTTRKANAEATTALQAVAPHVLVAAYLHTLVQRIVHKVITPVGLLGSRRLSNSSSSNENEIVGTPDSRVTGNNSANFYQ